MGEGSLISSMDDSDNMQPTVFPLWASMMPISVTAPGLDVPSIHLGCTVPPATEVQRSCAKEHEAIGLLHAGATVWY